MTEEKTLDELNREMYAKLAAQEKEENRRNVWLLRAIESVRGKPFAEELTALIKDLDGINGAWEIARQSDGTFNDEDDGGAIKGYWCKQMRTNYGAEDSYSGYVYIEIKPGRFLKVAFSC